MWDKKEKCEGAFVTGQDIKVTHDQENNCSLKPPDWPFPHGLQTSHLAQRQTGVIRILLQFALIRHERPGPLMQLFVPALLDFLHTKQRSWILHTQNNAHGFYTHKTTLMDFTHTKQCSWILHTQCKVQTIPELAINNQSLNILCLFTSRWY